MATHNSAIKAHKISLRNAARNKSTKSRIKTFIKKVESYIKEKNISKAWEIFRYTESIIMKAVTKKTLKLNTASRKVSQLARKVKSLEKEAEVNINTQTKPTS